MRAYWKIGSINFHACCFQIWKWWPKMAISASEFLWRKIAPIQTYIYSKRDTGIYYLRKKKNMASTQEQKKEIWIARKKRKRLDRKEASEAKNATLHYSIHTQVSCSRRNPGSLEEPNYHKELASKYYSKWSKSAREKKQVAKLWDKKHQTISLDVYTVRCKFL